MESRKHLISNVDELKKKLKNTHWENLFDTYSLDILAKTLISPILVATAVYPIELIQTRKQIKSSSMLLSTPFFLSNGQLLLKGFVNAHKSSLLKNAIISNKETVHEHVNEAINEKENFNKEKMANNLTTSQELKVLTCTSFLIGIADTTATNYLANLRVRNALGEHPVFPGLKSKMKFASLGYGPRLYRNFSNAFFCISANTIFNKPIDSVINPEEYEFANKAGKTVLAGCIGGVATNGLDVAYKNTIAQANLVNMQAPSLMKVVNQLMKEQGFKVFTRGASYSMLQTSIAYSVLEAFNFYYTKYIEEQRNITESNVKPK